MKKKSVVAKSTTTLPSNYRKALSLLQKTNFTLKEIADNAGISYDEFCDLYAGKPADSPIVQLFSSELKKIDTQKTDKMKRLMRENKLIVLEEINDFLLDMRKRGVRDEDTLVKILNALAKASSGGEITANIQNNIFSGMSVEELIHEYRRLSALAASS